MPTYHDSLVEVMEPLNFFKIDSILNTGYGRVIGPPETFSLPADRDLTLA